MLILWLSLLTVGSAVAPGALGIVAHAEENTFVSNSIKNFDDLTTNTVKLLDKYIVVENNQYRLELPVNMGVSENQIKQANDAMEIANKQIKKENAILDPSTKTYVTQSYRSGLYTSGGYTYDNFWWGTRYYFRSNNAVYQMDHDLDNYSIISGLAGALGGLASAGIGSAVGAIGAAYFQKMRSDLDYYNNTHMNDYVNMDVYFTGIYKIYSA